jgi:hypothetical protein
LSKLYIKLPSKQVYPQNVLNLIFYMQIVSR